MLLFVLIALVACDISKCLDNDKMVNLFSSFVQKHGKVYGDDHETSKRYLTFCENVHYIFDMKKQAASSNGEWSADWMGITEFTDWTSEEFRSKMLSKGYSAEELKKGVTADVQPVNDLPDDWNWNDHGAVTPVKNQGACGSCWAFSSTGNMEGQWFLANNTLTSFSEQQLVDCDPQSDGCQGGLMDWAFEYILSAGGAETEDEYPYKGYNEDCNFDKSKVVASFTNYTDLPSDEDQLQSWCYQNGPIAVAMDAILLQFYFGGIFDPPKLLCPGKILDHGVLIVGWGQEKGLFKEKYYWVVKNSWGASWGESGFFKIKRGDGKCGINTCASSIVV